MSTAENPLLHYEVDEGTGPHLLLVHGMLASRAQWLPNRGPLSAVCRPVVVELFGHGRSPTPADPALYRPEHYVREFERIRTALGAERWSICGQSLGAALTLRYALDHPDRIHRQIFTNSNSALAEGRWGDLVRTAMAAQARRLERDGSAALEDLPIHPSRARRIAAPIRDALVADCGLHDPQGIALTGLHTVPESPVRDRLGSNRVPTLLVVGEREKRFASHREFAERTMPKLEVVGFETGHAVNLEAASGFNEAVARFLAG